MMSHTRNTFRVMTSTTFNDSIHPLRLILEDEIEFYTIVYHKQTTEHNKTTVESEIRPRKVLNTRAYRIEQDSTCR